MKKVVIVGAGIAGPMAAISAKQTNPNLDVMLIEKTQVFGGGAAMSAAWISSFIMDTADSAETEGFTTMMWNMVNPALPGFPPFNPDKFLDIARAATDFRDFLIDAGLTWTLIHNGMTAEIIGGSYPMVTAIEREVLAYGIDLEFGWGAQRLIVTDGAITGVEGITDEGRNFRINARKVILATGGFSRHEAILQEFGNPDIMDSLMYFISTAAIGATGSGIDMVRATNVNADLYDSFQVSIQGTQFAEALHLALAPIEQGRFVPYFIQQGFVQDMPHLQMQNQILVDADGARFPGIHGQTGAPVSSEDVPIAWMGGGDTARGMFERNNPPYFVIFDSNNPHSEHNFNAALNAAHAAMPTEVFRADSIPALATAIGAVNLAATVAAYNDYYGGYDQWNKPVNKRIEQGPFFAVRLFPNVSTTAGGMVTNSNGQVLRNGVPIPNLYAAGEVSNRDLTTTGSVLLGGVSLSLYPAHGILAGRHAAQALTPAP